MIIYYDKKDNLNITIETTLNSLNMEIDTEKSKLEILSECLTHLNSIIQNTNHIDNPNELIFLLQNLKSNLDFSRENISDLKKSKKILEDFMSKNNNISFVNNDEAFEQLDAYNKSIINYTNKISDSTSTNFKDFILDYIKHTTFMIDSSQKNNNSESKEDLMPESCTKSIITSESQDSKIITDNNILIISEIQKKVFLPYSVSDLQKKLKKNHDYQNLQDVINAEYIIPIDRYKNSILSRFKETYNLMRKKENSSISDSLDLSLELAFNNFINPAIITACKNLDELDIYLDCLASNELDKFTIFKIKYEILPR